MEGRHFKYFNLIFIIFASMISILSPFIPFSLMMNIVGAVVCYFFIYLFPTLMHYNCLYKPKANEESLLESITSLEDAPSTAGSSACSHPSNYVAKKSKFSRFLLYGVINTIGIVIGIYGLYSCVKQIVG